MRPEPGWALGIDTAGPVVGVALWRAGARAPAWSRTERVVRGADALLLPWIADALTEADRDPGEGRGLVAVSVGPGAFTGLRVGISLAMGIALSRGLQVVPVSSLAARAALGTEPVLALLDARKERVYSGFYTIEEGVPSLQGVERDAPVEAVFPVAPFCCVGEGAVVYRVAIEAAGGRVLPDADRCPAAELARFALALPARLRCSPAMVAPHYIRPADISVPRAAARMDPAKDAVRETPG